MKKILMVLVFISSFGLLAGCCTDDMVCGSDMLYTTSCHSCSSCQTCGNSCGTCGSNVGYSSYTYGGWY